MGVGSSWPHDFLFFVVFFSSGLESSSFTSGLGVSREVSDGEMVKFKISEPGVADIESSDVNGESIVKTGDSPVMIR